MTKYHAPALDKGLDILEFLSANSAAQSQAEIANGLKRSSNEVYRMLVCLEARKYIVKDAVSGKYQLTLRLFQIAHRHSPVDALQKASKRPLEHLAQSIKQSCHISVLDQNQLMIVAQARNPGPVSLSVEIGGRFPLFLTTSGKIFLAFKEDQERAEMLASSAHFQKLSKQQQKTFYKKLDQVRDNRYLVEKSDLTLGVTDIATPIGTENSGIVSVLAASCLTTQIGEPILIDKAVQDIQSTAQAIMVSLGIDDL